MLHYEKSHYQLFLAPKAILPKYILLVLLHQHSRQDGRIGRLRRCAGELAAQDRQRAVAASLIVHPLTDLHRKVVVRIRRALDYTSVLGLVPIRD